MVSFFKEGLERNFVGILVYWQGIFKQTPSAKIARIAESFGRFSYLRRRRENIRNKTGRKAVFVSLQHAVRVQCPSDYEAAEDSDRGRDRAAEKQANQREGENSNL